MSIEEIEGEGLGKLVSSEEGMSLLEEVTKIKKTLGIGSSLDERIEKLKTTSYQYCSAGTARLLVEEIERLRMKTGLLNEYYDDIQVMRAALKEIASFTDAGDNIGMSETCGHLRRVAIDTLEKTEK